MESNALEIVATILSGMEDKEIKSNAYETIYNLIKNEQNLLIQEEVIYDRNLGDSKNLLSIMAKLISNGFIKHDKEGFMFCRDKYSEGNALSKEDKLYLRGLGKKLADSLQLNL